MSDMAKHVEVLRNPEVLAALAAVILKAQEVHEESYAKDHMEAAAEVLGLPEDWMEKENLEANVAFPVYLLNATVWHDIQMWAEQVLGINADDDLNKTKLS